MPSNKNTYLSDIFSKDTDLKKFFDNNCQAFLFVDDKGRIHYTNTKTIRILGFSKKDLLDQELFQFLADKKSISAIKSAIKDQNGLSRCFQLNFRKKNNSVLPADVILSSVQSGNGKTLCCTISESSNEKSEIEKLREEKEEAIKLARIKTEYIAQLSHEIRSPLNLMMNFTSLIREVLETETRKALKEEFAIINNAGKRIIRTVDLVLNMSEIQSGNFQICKTEFDLYKEIVFRIENDFKNYAKERKLKFTVKNTVDDPMIFADEYSVFQAVNNVVDNSFKYTEQGKIEIKLGRDRKSQLYVLVSDTGIGMSEEYQKDLFKPFHQEDNGFVGKIKGNGLGLSLVKKYCELNDMKIEVNSKKNVGTKIKFVFPN